MVASHVEDALACRPGQSVGGDFKDVAAVDGLDKEGVVGEGEDFLFHDDCLGVLGEKGWDHSDWDLGGWELDGHLDVGEG